MLYLTYTSYDDIDAAQPPASGSATGSAGPAGPSSTSASGGENAGIKLTTGPTDEQKRLWETVQEDPVDLYWRARDGKIPRQRDAKFCKHGAKGMCDYCMPIEVCLAFGSSCSHY
jgi:nuclear protein localization family protein 4